MRKSTFRPKFAVTLILVLEELSPHIGVWLAFWKYLHGAWSDEGSTECENGHAFPAWHVPCRKNLHGTWERSENLISLSSTEAWRIRIDSLLLPGGLLEPSKGGTGIPERPGGCCCCDGGTWLGWDGTGIPPLIGMAVEGRPVAGDTRVPLIGCWVATGPPCTGPDRSAVAVSAS